MTEKIGFKYTSWCEPLNRWIGALWDPAHTWPTAARRAYVLTWPISLIVRAMVWLLLAVAVVGAMLAGVIAKYFTCVWHGKRIDWDD